MMENGLSASDVALLTGNNGRNNVFGAVYQNRTRKPQIIRINISKTPYPKSKTKRRIL